MTDAEVKTPVSDADLDAHKAKIKEIVAKFAKADNMLFYLNQMVSAKEPILAMKKAHFIELQKDIPRLEKELGDNLRQIDKMSAYIAAHKDSIDDAESGLALIKKMDKMAKRIQAMREELGEMGPIPSRLVGTLPPPPIA